MFGFEPEELPPQPLLINKMKNEIEKIKDFIGDKNSKFGYGT